MVLKKQGGEGGSGKMPRKTNRRRTQTTARGKAFNLTRKRGRKTSGGNGDTPKQHGGS